MARPDPHSFFDDTHPRVASLELAATVDFDARRLRAVASLAFVTPAAPDGDAGPLDLDTRGLTIESVTALDGAALRWELAPTDPILGERLRVMVPRGVTGVAVRYQTAPDASALQWLAPSMTAGGVQPFVFSQCQAIHARSVAPLQDSPAVRITYRAELTVPRALRALMAARFVERREADVGGLAVERWEMPQPIPPYLLAFAVGELAARDLGLRSRVWAEPSVVERAAAELVEVDDMLRAAEALFGPYDWERFDLLVMPPAFPYGGMENPRLTFLTPTLLAGDRSLVNVVAHELAHSWTGNLVTNANAEHFWLNEGFTVFAERRIVEALWGADVAALEAALGRRGLDEAIRRFADRPALTRLRTRLDGIDPDAVFSEIPYEKGYLFLRALEEAAGRAAFDRFLREWLDGHRFGAVTTDDFVAACERALPGVLARVGAERWLDGEGVPADAPVARSARLERVEALVARGPLPLDAETARGLRTVEWQLWLEGIAPALRAAGPAACEALDLAHGLTARGNAEVLVAWLEAAVPAGYAPAVARAEALVGEVGRMKYLRPLYRALLSLPDGRARAERAFQAASPGYHPIAREVVSGLIAAAAGGDSA
jgi:aminopeptidase N